MVYNKKTTSQMRYNLTFRMSKLGSTLQLQCEKFVASYEEVNFVNTL